MHYRKILTLGITALLIAATPISALAASSTQNVRGGAGGPGYSNGQQTEQQMEMQGPPPGERQMQMPPRGEQQMPREFEEGERPELPEGFEEGERPELPEGFEEGERPELPEGFEEGERPELPEGFVEGERPELPEGLEEGERPELPEGFEEGERPELPEGFEEGERPELPEGFEEGDQSSQIQDSQKTGGSTQDQNFIHRIGNSIKSGFQKIGNWFSNLFNRNSEDADNNSNNIGNGNNIDSGNTDNIFNEKAGGLEMAGGAPGGSGFEMPGGAPGGSGFEMAGNAAPESYDSAYTATEDIDGGGTLYFSSTKSDQNAILVDGETLSISGVSVSKTGDSDGESADFYGINAGILADNGAELTISDVSVNTDGTHANGIFSYGEGTVVTVSGSSITTTGNNSGGLMTTGGGTLIADSVTISTSGNSSAAIRTDRGGGTVSVSNSDGTTSGTGSPAVYSTADITVSDSTLSATNSEAVVIEGGNSVTVTNSSLTGNNATLNGQSTKATNVLIYQSMSGDAQEGESSFNMTGGSLTSLTGSMIHVTNVTTTISLTDVELTYADDSDVLLDLSADSWGTSGQNGGNATVYLKDQTAEGQILVDSVSSLILDISDGSSYTGAINSNGSSGTVKVSLSEDSIWTLTGDTYIDSFDGDLDQVDLNGFTLYINGVAYN